MIVSSSSWAPAGTSSTSPSSGRWPISLASPRTSSGSAAYRWRRRSTFYRCADVFVYPSFNETFGLPILEAMATACPVVTSDTSAMPETAGGCALLADPKDPDSLPMPSSKPVAPRGSGCGRRPGAGREFTWAATAERTLAVYREVYARRAAGGGRR